MKENHDHGRLHRGVVVPDPRFLDGTVDLLAAENGGRLVVDVYPDGGLSRLRLFGDLDEQALSDARRTWWDALPPSHQALVADRAPR